MHTHHTVHASATKDGKSVWKKCFLALLKLHQKQTIKDSDIVQTSNLNFIHESLNF